MRCFYCHHEIDQNCKFCPFCGKPQVLTCANCGSQVSAGQAYCAGCGAKLGTEPGNASEREERTINTAVPKIEEETGKGNSSQRTEQQLEVLKATVGVGRRFLALLIDTIILYMVNYYFAISYGAAKRTLNSSSFSISYSMDGWPAFVTTVIDLGYFLLLEAILGATVGKLVLGLRVIKEDGSRIGFRDSIIRNLLRIVDAIPFLIPYLLGAVYIWKSPAKQRLGDRVAKTLVVRAGVVKQFAK